MACAASAAFDLPCLIELTLEERWRACVITTPLGRRFVDADKLAKLTGERVRSDFRMPDEPNELPATDAAVVAPATFNTINKWATGVADNFAVGLPCELMGFDVPIVAVPLLNPALARHHAFTANVEALRTMGVRVLFDPDAPPRTNAAMGTNNGRTQRTRQKPVGLDG